MRKWWTLCGVWVAVLLVSAHATQKTVRIVSLSPVITEIIYDLGAQDILVGRSVSCTYPNDAKTLPVVADAVKLYSEQLIQTKPTLVVGLQNFNEASAGHLSRLHIRCVLLKNPQTVDDIAALIRQIGTLVNKEAEAKRCAQKLYSELPKNTPFKRQPRVLVLVNATPFIGVGKHTLIDDILQKAGCQNALSSTYATYPKLSAEQILQVNPDWVLVSEKQVGNSLKRDVLLKKLGCVQRGRVIDTIHADLFTRPGPRVLQGIHRIHSSILLH